MDFWGRNTVPYMSPTVEYLEISDDGVLCMWQLELIGEYFQRQLLQSRHRGAFELAYAGFVKMTHTLWRSRISAAHCLPGRWLSELMSKVVGLDPSDQLCSTRRSAGVPFFVQVLIDIARY